MVPLKILLCIFSKTMSYRMRRTTNNKGNLKLLKTMELELSYFGMQNHNFPKNVQFQKLRT